jgi:amino acid transporter
VLSQFFGWMVGANTMLEYLLAGSTVAKGFASYFTTMIGEAAGSIQLVSTACARWLLSPTLNLSSSPCTETTAHLQYMPSAALAALFFNTAPQTCTQHHAE